MDEAKSVFWEIQVTNQQRGRWVFAILLASCILRIAAIGYVQNYQNPEDWEYGDIAENIVAGNGFSGSAFFLGMPLQPTSIKAPLYPYLLAFFLKFIPQPYLMLQLLQVLISLAAGLMLYYFARTLFEHRIALAALAFYGFHPTFIYIPTQFLPLAIYLLHLGIGAWLWQRHRMTESSRYLIWFGVNAGFAMLQDTIFFSICGAVAFTWLWQYRQNWKRLAKVWMLAFVPVLVMVAPWTIRNYQVHHEFVFIKSPVGYNLWRGNHPGATGTARTMAGASIDETMSQDLQAQLQQPAYTSEIAKDRLMGEAAKEFITSQPGEFFRISMKRLYYFWWFDPTHDKAKNPIYRISYLLILFPGVCGAWMMRKHFREHLPLYLHAMILSAIYTITLIVPRYHMQIDYFMIPFACIAFNQLYIGFRHRLKC
jgi:hypothetical protein